MKLTLLTRKKVMPPKDGYGVAGMELAGTAANAGFGILATHLSNKYAAEREAVARKENYEYNEKAAANADIRTRSLYNDLYSPSAIMSQLKAAGLSPSIFYGDTPGSAGQTGAMGAGASGVSPTTFGVQPMELANLGLLAAQTEKLKAETNNINEDTTKKELENEVKKLDNSMYKYDWELLSMYIYNEDNPNEKSSMFDEAAVFNSYEAFKKHIQNVLDKTDNALGKYINTEKGAATLRTIYENATRYESTIETLTADTENAKLEASIAKCLNNSDFANLNAKAAVQYLRANVEINELDERQKAAWNKLLNRLEKSSTTLHDVTLIMYSIINAFMQRSSVNFSVGRAGRKSE